MSSKALHALRLYLSPVFTRENPSFFSGLLFATVCGGFTLFEHTPSHWVEGVFKLPPSLGTWWWLALQALLSSIACHYWRQIRSPLASITPGMISAEYYAALCALAVILALMALPLTLIGAPPLNVLAQESLCVALSVNGDMVGPKNLRKPMRLMRMVLMFVVFAAFMFPHAQELVLSAPWYGALALCALGLGLTFIELHHRPHPLSQIEAPQSTQPPTATPQLHKGTPPARLSHLLMWQLPWLRNPAVPHTMVTPGPVGFLLSFLVCIISFVLLITVVAVVSHLALPTGANLKNGLRTAPVIICMLFTSSLSNWLLARADWPFMLSLAGYGTRRDFAFALYATHAKRTLQLACMVSLTCAPLAVGVAQDLPWARLPLLTACLFCCIVGVSYLPSLAIVCCTKGQNIILIMLNMLGAFIGLQAAFVMLFTAQPAPWWLYTLIVACLPFAAFMAWAAPRALARSDWSIQPPNAP